MSEFTYESQGTSTYLVYAIKSTDMIDNMSLGMITNNKIPGLATTIFTQMDEDRYIKYNVSSRLSASQIFEGPVNRKRIVGIFKGVVNALLAAEEYMLDENSILLDLDYIFADVTTCDTVLICLPVQTNKAKVTLGAFFKEIMFSTQFDQTENCDYVAKIMNYLNSTPMFSLMEFGNILEKIENAVTVVEQSVTKEEQQKNVASTAKQKVNSESISISRVQGDVISVQSGMQVAKTVQNVGEQTGKGASTLQQSVPIHSERTYNVPVASNEVNNSIKKTEETGNESTGISGEKEVSLFYLMQHYNKENAALYKAQKEARKKNKGNKGGNAKILVNNTKSSTDSMVGFAIPGQQVSEVTVTKASTFVQPSVISKETSQPKIQESFLNSPETFHRQSTDKQQPTVQSTVQPIAPAVTMTPTQMAFGGAGFGETTVLGTSAIGETTVLSQVQNPMQPVTPYLIRTKTNEKIMLTKPLFRIGKERSFVDYFIVDNTAISRCHAQIVNHDGEYYVVDTNSTNHTFVNSMMINSNEEVKISDGDKVRLANEDFEFHLR